MIRPFVDPNNRFSYEEWANNEATKQEDTPPMGILTDEEIANIPDFPWELTTQYVRRIEELIIKKLSEQEPVAWMHPSGGVLRTCSTGLERKTYTIPLYTHPMPVYKETK